jgi:hypothetical protein
LEELLDVGGQLSAQDTVDPLAPSLHYRTGTRQRLACHEQNATEPLMRRRMDGDLMSGSHNGELMRGSHDGELRRCSHILEHGDVCAGLLGNQGDEALKMTNARIGTWSRS